MGQMIEPRAAGPRHRSAFSRGPLLAFVVIAVTRPAAAASLSVDGWSLSSEIECGNAASIVRVGADHVAIAPREDAIPVEIQVTGPISSFVVSCLIVNERPAARVLTVDVLIPRWMLGGPKGRFDHFLRRPYLLREPGGLQWIELGGGTQIDLPDRVRLSIPLGPRAKRILSSIPAYPYSALLPELEAIAGAAGGKAHIRQIGESTERRPIWSLELGEPSRPVLAFTATAQSGEPSAWAILAMARAAVADPSLRKLRRPFRLVFLPMPNPDGVYHGHANTNANGRIVVFEFDRAAAGQEVAPETGAVWNYLSGCLPVALVDFHFLSLTNHARPQPHVIDPFLLNDPVRRPLFEQLAAALGKLSDLQTVRPIPGTRAKKGLLVYQAITRWNTAAILYQNTGPLTSHEQSRQRGVEILTLALQLASKNEPGARPLAVPPTP